ncbi:HWE histidine kinase domain-containing protein [uncultured Erythrobacter sp.]|uniref:sensor histidine kinase n=1 Tax=uncultured Erythrobacter sp. TaxID=263913 RepID=UPI00262D286F|nr:HWE histidine kinase domain-containing protein [uncultured Erythrobacter sp.]
MIEDIHLDEDAREALALKKVFTREVRSEDGRLFSRQVEPYKSDFGGVIVTYNPIESAQSRSGSECKARAEHAKDLSTEDLIQSLTMGVTKIGVWTIDTDGSSMEWDQRFAEIVGLGKIPTPATQAEFANYIFDEDRAEFDQRIAAVPEDGSPQDFELRYCPPSKETIWLQLRCARVENPGGAVIVGIIADITERKGDRERSEFMMRELDHRVKNLLAIILSIAEISARSNSDIETYKADFRERLESMARTHNLLSQTQWAGSDMFALVEGETLSLAPKDSVSLEGPSLQICPTAAQSLAMFIHELTANALKHGALSSEAGRVSVSWKRTEDRDGRLRLSWEESGGPKVSEPSSEGFGGKVINRIVKRQLDAEVETEWRSDGMRLTAWIPLSNIEALSKPDASDV